MGTHPAELARAETLWTPPADRSATAVGRYANWLEATGRRRVDDYDDLWSWSTTDLAGFWTSIWDYFGVESSTPWADVVAGDMTDTRWFAGATLNYAEHVLCRLGGGDVVTSLSQLRPARRLGADELRDRVARCMTGLRRLGVGRGDRVAAYVPNTDEAVVAMLAATGLGAVWASCPPEFGVDSVVDRLTQLVPTVLFAGSGYAYGDKYVDRRDEVHTITTALPSLETVVDIGYGREPIAGALPWADLLAVHEPLRFERVGFADPLYVLFSSGTTGRPKAIVHGHGGILLEHLKVLTLHHDVGPTDRMFCYTTTGWMMWNYLVSALATGAGIVLFDGNPNAPDLAQLWRVVADERVSAFGVSSPYLMNCRREGLDLGLVGEFSALRTAWAVGAPLPAEGFRWVYEQLPHVWLSSGSGGTDVCSGLVGGSPLVPVVAGEISCRHLGCAVDSFDPDGRPVRGVEGELVITRPMPSMPVGLLGDPDRSRYRAAYFEHYPGIWRHGDWINLADDGSCVIVGRSDATLNRGGVRLGTSEFYTVLDDIDAVADSLVVHLEGEGIGTLVLFVELADGGELDEMLRGEIVRSLRARLSPRHVPDEIHAVSTIPKTHSGKKLEVPVKQVLKGASAEAVATAGSLADPRALDAVVEIALRRTGVGA